MRIAAVGAPPLARAAVGREMQPEDLGEVGERHEPPEEDRRGGGRGDARSDRAGAGPEAAEQRPREAVRDEEERDGDPEERCEGRGLRTGWRPKASDAAPDPA